MGVYHIIVSLYGMVWHVYLSYNYLPLWYGMCVYHIIISLYEMVGYGCLLSPFKKWLGMDVYHIIISLYGMVWHGCLSYNYLPLWYGLVWVFII